jgi:choline-sulfatase
VNGYIGRLLDTVEARDDADHTVICFVSDHGELLGDHNGWQKENYFEAATRIPFLLSWPEQIPSGALNQSLVCLEDIFGIVTSAGGNQQLRDGADVLSVARGETTELRDQLIGVFGTPATDRFKVMVRWESYKLIWMANGGEMQLFDLNTDPLELVPLVGHQELKDLLMSKMVEHLRGEGLDEAFSGDELWQSPWSEWPQARILQFDASRGINGFGASAKS